MKTLLLLAATAAFAAAQQCSNFLTEEDKSMDTWLHCLENKIKFEDRAPSGYEWGKGLPTNNKRKKRFILDDAGRFEWPNGRVPYNISCDFNQCQRAQIAQAMAMFHEDTCISFEPATAADAVSNGGVLQIVRNDTLNKVGVYEKHFKNYHFVNGKARFYSFDHYLIYKNDALDGFSFTAIHELYHSLGFQHEHQRPDRPTADYRGYPTESPSNIMTLGPFDVNSISHYRIGLRNDLSAVLSYSDVWRINKLYNCTRTTNGKPIILASEQPDVNIVRPEPTYATKAPNSCTQADKKQPCEFGYLYVYDRATKTIKKTEVYTGFSVCVIEIDGKRAVLSMLNVDASGTVCATGVVNNARPEYQTVLVSRMYHARQCDVVVETLYPAQPQIICLHIPGGDNATTTAAITTTEAATTTTTSTATSTTAGGECRKQADADVLDWTNVYNFERASRKMVVMENESFWSRSGFDFYIDGVQLSIDRSSATARCFTYAFSNGVLSKKQDGHAAHCDTVFLFAGDNSICLQVV